MTGAIVAAALAATPFVGLWLWFRERRKARERGEVGAGAGSDLLGAGFLEAQRLLEPERKVEIVRERLARDAEGEVDQDLKEDSSTP